MFGTEVERFEKFLSYAGDRARPFLQGAEMLGARVEPKLEMAGTLGLALRRELLTPPAIECVDDDTWYRECVEFAWGSER